MSGADGQAREEALDPRRSFIVQAPAGAGKTELLTQRFLVLLAHAAAPEEVLAITFTRKAVREMLNRVLGALDLAAGDEPPEAPHRRRTWELARRVLERDRALGWALRKNPLRLRIQTFDALCASLARRMPVTAGFGAPPAVVEDAEPLYRQAARRALRELDSAADWAGAIEHLLGHLDSDVGRLEQLLVDMLGQRDQWLGLALEADDRAALEKALGDVRADAAARARESIPAEVAPRLQAVLLQALCRDGDDPAEKARIEAALAAGLPGPDEAGVALWEEAARILLTGRGEWRRKFTAREGFPAPSGARGPERARREQRKAEVEAVVEALQGHEEVGLRLAALRRLPPPTYTDAQWQTLGALRDVLKLAVGALELTFQERGEADFPRVAMGALAALGTPEAPSDLLLALDRRIRHVLVDEFQDTSLLQYRILEGLTAGWEPDDGRTLFLVGDPMQSIYRFREADVGLYLRARAEGIGSVRLEPLGLGLNFRSQAGLIDWINGAFQHVFPLREDAEEGAVRYTPSQAHHPGREGQAVVVHPLIDDSAEAEAEQVLAAVAGALAEDPAASVAVLVRSRSHLVEVVPRLKAAGLRFSAVELEHLASRPVVRDLQSLALALTHPGDRLAWLSVLRAPWCGIELADLERLVGGEEAAIPDLLKGGAWRETLSADGSLRLGRVWKVLEPALAERGRRPLRARLEGAWLGLGGPGALRGEADLADARAFLDALEEVSRSGDLIDREALGARMRTLHARAGAGDDVRVQVMTIHRAKGLEFDAVVVPGLGQTPPPPRSQLWIWAQRTRGDLLLAPIRAANDLEKDPIYEYVAALDRVRGEHEDGRLLYVAATRARQRLHLLGRIERAAEGVCRPQARSLLARLWPAVSQAFEAAAAGLDGDGRGESPDGEGPADLGDTPLPRLLARLPAGWAPPLPPPSLAGETRPPETRVEASVVVEFAWATETARRVGTVTHRFLQELARRGAAAPEAVDLEAEVLRRAIRRALGAEGVPATDLDEAEARVRHALHQTLEDPRGRWILDPGHRDGHSELALTGVLDGEAVAAVIDRSFIDAEGVRWVIDYKTGSHEGGGLEDFLDREQERYREQLERYARLLAAGDDRPIRLGLYFPLLRGWREWAPEEVD